MSGGANYVIDKKFSIGPKLALGFGAFNSYALTANASVHFLTTVTLNPTIPPNI